ncbi:alpha/beta hydrolase [Janibacter indicus]|uniref:Alpha/beta hydrolase n=1 Tax=Janibacter indicus TaxID=857417 RepID=A0A7L9J0F7_9MICO|nr:alpha/beta hydrolase [Janibacter indicus]QOK22722.1 alpha/beta hydrolase [Janibacter indicus]
MLRRLIYPVPAWDPEGGLPVETTAAGTHLVHAPAPEGGRTIVYFHGNGSDLASISPLAGLFARHGLGFAAVEYPGYGPAAGRPHQEAILAAARDGLAHLSLRAERTVLVGESLGSSVAAHLAAEGLLHDGGASKGGGRLVLVSPFTSMTAMVQRVVGVFPRQLVPDRWETDALLERIDVPTLLVHGERDDLVPLAMSEQLARGISSSQRVVVPGRTHNDLWEAPSECLEVVARFATQDLGGAAVEGSTDAGRNPLS